MKTLQAVRDMRPCDRNAAVAELVLGWQVGWLSTFVDSAPPHDCRYIGRNRDGKFQPLPDFGTSAAADLDAHMAACAWDYLPRMAYWKALGEILMERWMTTTAGLSAMTPDTRRWHLDAVEHPIGIHRMQHYQIGDYATAALAAALELAPAGAAKEKELRP